MNRNDFRTTPEEFRKRFENVDVLHENMLESHAYMIPFATQKSALRNQKSDSPYYVSLNGQWIFSYYQSYTDVPEGFEKGKGSRCLSEFDITDVIENGDNRLTVYVAKYCDQSYFEDQDGR